MQRRFWNATVREFIFWRHGKPMVSNSLVYMIVTFGSFV